MQVRKKRIYRIGLGIVLGSLVTCGASGAAAVYIGPGKILGPSYQEVHGTECRTVAATKTKDSDGIWIRQYIVADAQDDLTRMRTALRVAEAIVKEQSPHLVQVSVVDAGNPGTVASMRGRAIGAQVTIIPKPVTEAESNFGPYSGFSIQGSASTDGEFHGIRFEAIREDLEAMASKFEELKGCAAAPGEGA